ncbi:transposase, partial [Frankia gtarii]|uniref:transposase n=1 Tax=Frankia gtarii TaxID=2950102 RepID=UPI0021C21344
MVGVDVGVASFLTTSNGEHEPNPTCLERSAGRLAVAQRDLSRRRRGSARCGKAATRVGTISRGVARQRFDHAHRTALGLVCGHDLIAVEKLAVTGMVRRARPGPGPDLS